MALETRTDSGGFEVLSPTDEINEALGYDADVMDSSQYCKHGTFVGSWSGPDYMCSWCESGCDPCQYCGNGTDATYTDEPATCDGCDLAEKANPGILEARKAILAEARRDLAFIAHELFEIADLNGQEMVTKVLRGRMNFSAHDAVRGGAKKAIQYLEEATDESLMPEPEAEDSAQAMLFVDRMMAVRSAGNILMGMRA